MSTDLQSRAGAPRSPASRRPRIGGVRSSLGLKITMAVSGILLVAFIIAHMAGNLHVFEGREAMNEYAHGLRTLLEPLVPYESVLWVLRIGLIVAVGAHIWSAIVLTRRARRARPVKYAHRPPVKGEGSYAARTMRWGGVVIVLFVVWHLLDLTLRVVNPVKDVPDAYGAVVAGFAPERWYITVFYLIAVVALGFHLRHGIWSAVQTIAGPDNTWRKRSQIIAAAIAFIVTAGFVIVPLSVTFGLVS